jgi:ATP-binding cassette subfamily B protein
VFGRESRNFATFGGINAAHRDVNIDGIFYYAVFYPAIEFVSALATAMIIFMGGGWVGEGTLTLGAMVAFIQYAQRFFRPISDMSEKFNVLQSAMASSERIFGLLDTPISISSPAAPVVLPVADGAARGHIVFEHVWFAYRDEAWVLRDVSFEVQPGQRVGVVGATGAGKTTVINLVLRFYDVQQGRILVDGIDVRDWPLQELRRRFGLVLQDVHLFSGTVAGNIRLGSAHLDDDVVRRREAARRRVHARMPDGQRPWPSARHCQWGRSAVVVRPRWRTTRGVGADEATSSVDTETELLIRDALRTLMFGFTSPSPSPTACRSRLDRILVMHRGELREQGQLPGTARPARHLPPLYRLQRRDLESRLGLTGVRPQFRVCGRGRGRSCRWACR